MLRGSRGRAVVGAAFFAGPGLGRRCAAVRSKCDPTMRTVWRCASSSSADAWCAAPPWASDSLTIGCNPGPTLCMLGASSSAGSTPTTYPVGTSRPETGTDAGDEVGAGNVGARRTTGNPCVPDAGPTMDVGPLAPCSSWLSLSSSSCTSRRSFAFSRCSRTIWVSPKGDEDSDAPRSREAAQATPKHATAKTTRVGSMRPCYLQPRSVAKNDGPNGPRPCTCCCCAARLFRFVQVESCLAQVKQVQHDALCPTPSWEAPAQCETLLARGQMEAKPNNGP